MTTAQQSAAFEEFLSGVSARDRANIVGGCCGSTPEHIRAFRGAVDAYLKETAKV